MGSASETEYHLLLAHDLHYLNTDDYEALSTNIIEIKRMLAALIKKLTTEH
jgi:four helix bundle protein